MVLLPQDQLDSMVQAGNSVTNTPQQPASGNPPWLQSMLDAGLKSQQSAAVLGHATALAQNSFQTPLTNMASGQSGNNMDVAIGAGKQALSDLSMAGAQNAGPVGKDMLAHAPAFAQNIDSFNQAMKPSNISQAVGGGLTTVAEGVAPFGSAKVTGEASGILGKLGDMTGVTKFLTDRSLAKATNAVQSTAETMTKGEREAAIAEGRLQSGTFKNTYLPSQTDTRAGEILNGKVGKNPIKNAPVVQSEIAARGKEAEQFLADNAKPITNEEDFKAFQDQRAKTETYLTPTATKSYDEMINVFQRTLKKYTGDGGYNTSNYYQALKDFESNVTQNLPKGKEALLDEGGSARLQAAKDVRSVVRDIIGQKNPEFKGKMFDLASLYGARDNVITKAEKSGHAIQQFGKNHPYITGAAAFGAGEIGLNEARKLTGI